LNGAKIKRSV